MTDERRSTITLTTNIFLFQIECQMTDLQMFQFVLVQIRPTPDPSVDHVRKSFPSSDLCHSKTSLTPLQTHSLINPTCNRPSSVLWIVTHLVGICPLEVIEATSASNSSFLSFNFFTRLSRGGRRTASFVFPRSLNFTFQWLVWRMFHFPRWFVADDREDWRRSRCRHRRSGHFHWTTRPRSTVDCASEGEGKPTSCVTRLPPPQQLRTDG